LIAALDLVRELPAGYAEVLFNSGSADAIGGHHTQTDRHSFFWPVITAITVRVRSGA
jgi:hypothetical protein